MDKNLEQIRLFPTAVAAGTLNNNNGASSYHTDSYCVISELGRVTFVNIFETSVSAL